MARSLHVFAAVAARSAAFFLVWLALDDNASEPELLTGAAVALCAAAAVSLWQRARADRLRPRAWMLRYFYRLPVVLIADTARVCLALCAALASRRPVRGRTRVVRFSACGDSPEEAARRALSEWGASFGPNRYAFEVDREAAVLVVHELIAAKGPLDPLELG